jgi:hypothetical protein
MIDIDKLKRIIFYLVKIVFFCFLMIACKVNPSSKPGKGLIGHWPLAGNAQDISGNEHHAVINGNLDLNCAGPDGSSKSAAGFNGYDSWLEIPEDKSPVIVKDDFSISVWIKPDNKHKDVPGDILSSYDSKNHNGFNLSLKSNMVTTSLANDRQVHFGIDNNQMSEWTDCGRPGNAICAFSLASCNGILYAGTCEPGKNESGHVYSYAGEKQWIDCGSPDSSNGVMALAVFEGKLFAGTGKYRLRGSALPESENPHLGGSVFRYEGGKKWTDCGSLPETEAIGGLVVYNGALYASSMFRPARFCKYEGDKNWKDCGTPEAKMINSELIQPRIEAMCVYNGDLYATSWDGGYVYRYDGSSWTDCGLLGNNTQTYSFAVYHGRLLVGTWPSGRVYRFEGINQWTDMGRLGNEREVMGMLVHNGRLIAGTLPLAEVYSYEGDTIWKKIGRLDFTPDVTYRRAWTMAENDGKVFCSTLPSGKIFSFQTGRNVISPNPLEDGWHHIVAIRSKDRMMLYIDGRESVQSSILDWSSFDMGRSFPLRIGFGTNDYFVGQMADLRIYNRELNSNEIRYLAEPGNISVTKKQITK